ncbi:hypothetical protein H7K28_15040 [Paenibacillus polymyxa]|jgi:hypothetical protein|nr:hypothetical protein [Paenibacillus polymyxa]MBY0024524.1 hypothetical protein [Paenibacillus polymyxa]MBY0058652.1 hypothetical protein [Paenibacillus polymyxa]MBY0071238.1 hypothetical protein [Paenibacillus polymyxa]MBY0078606.1 hypothetical protein [Paenibacillus polymyxa]MBZ6441691.1 hypothetical protein [Paenibacillus polymyxa]
MRVIYIKWHANYEELKLGETYQATRYKPGWMLIGTVLYRAGCFEEA